MCGIAGIFKFNNEPIDLDTLTKFTDSMYHRGPDGAGYELFESDTIGLGQRRLAILDLSDSGKQPMSYANQRYWITYNGEVFNFQEVKKELLSLNYQFKSNTDTEVILAAYIQWGIECLSKFNGMWAFAIWDSIEKELFLSRDRFGIKPLYYVYIPDKFFAFASETRAFKYLDGFHRRFNDELLQLNLNDSYALEGIGYTPFNNVLQLLPGHYLRIKRSAGISQKRWWDIKNHLTSDIPKTFEEQAEKFYEIFKDACRIRLISDVPIATALSGGLDSTSVYSTVYDIISNESLKRINKDSQRAFCAVFPGLPQDEKEYALKAANFVGGNINFVDTDYSNLAKQIETDTERSDLIISSPITALSSIYAGMKKHGVSVSMDGHGVDEMLYGYRNMIYSLYSNSLFHGSVSQVNMYSAILSNMYHDDKKNDVKKKFETELLQKNKREKSIQFALKKLFTRPEHNDNFIPVNLPQLSDSPYDFSNEPLDKRILYYDFFQHTLPALLRNFDRAGMLNSVEIRMPFMDWRLVSYVFSLPTNSKLGSGFTKLILRQAMKGKINEDLRCRTYKVGVGSPIEYWFNGSLKTWAMDSLSDIDLKKKIMNGYKNGNFSNSEIYEIWKNINVELIK
jgi:asparagine synthase (glutamine-hydrolysing)